MKLICSLLFIASFAYCQDDKTYSIHVTTNMRATRGKLFLNIYPAQDQDDCEKIVHPIKKKGKQTIKIPATCCWRKLKLIEEDKKSKEKLRLGTVTIDEASCEQGSLDLVIKKRKREEGMTIDPVDIEATIVSGKKKRS